MTDEANQGSRTFVDVNKSLFSQLRFIEGLQTSILAVDERLALELKGLDMVRSTPNDESKWDTWRALRLKVFDERKLKWTDLVSHIHSIASSAPGLHFLVLHLQYLEAQASLAHYGRDGKGIAQLLATLCTSTGHFPMRYLAVTTGRGRMGWYEELTHHETELSRQGVNILFVPPSALVSAVAMGVKLGDDLDVKLSLASRLLG